MRTKVAIVGAGPAGLLLSQLLHGAGVESVILERQSRAHVEARIRAGVLERGSVELLDSSGVGARMRREGLAHDGINLGVDGELFRIDLAGLTGSQVTVYGQTELTRDLIAAHVERGQSPLFDVRDVALHDVDTGAPFVTYAKNGTQERLDCAFIAGCDGSHGVSRTAIPQDVLQTFERAYPFGWLGILADVPPCNEELIYSSHAQGFALASMRSKTRSRYYVQVPLDERLEDWPDERLWDELAIRLGPQAAAHIKRGPALEKSIAPLRSFVAEPMQHGRLFLAGDAAHIVPPTGAKGLNLAMGDVKILADTLIGFYRSGDETQLKSYSKRALARVWKAERFSWWMTTLLHRFPETGAFDRKMQVAELDSIRSSRAAQTALAENYVGLPLG